MDEPEYSPVEVKEQPDSSATSSTSSEQYDAAFEARRKETLDTLFKEKNRLREEAEAEAKAKLAPARPSHSGLRTGPGKPTVSQAPAPASRHSVTIEKKPEVTISSLERDLEVARKKVARLRKIRFCSAAAACVIVLGIFLKFGLQPTTQALASTIDDIRRSFAAKPSVKPASESVASSEVPPDLTERSDFERQMRAMDSSGGTGPFASAVTHLTAAINAVPGRNSPEEIVREVNRRRSVSTGPVCPLTWNAAGEPVLQFGSNPAPKLFVASLDECAEAIDNLNLRHTRPGEGKSRAALQH